MAKLWLFLVKLLLVLSGRCAIHGEDPLRVQVDWTRGDCWPEPTHQGRKAMLSQPLLKPACSWLMLVEKRLGPVRFWQVRPLASCRSGCGANAGVTVLFLSGDRPVADVVSVSAPSRQRSKVMNVGICKTVTTAASQQLHREVRK